MFEGESSAAPLACSCAPQSSSGDIGRRNARSPPPHHDCIRSDSAIADATARDAAAGAVRFAQPSLIKCGGVAEGYRIAQLAAAAGVVTMPWSFCPGPGFLATVHLAAVLPDEDVMVEKLFADYHANLFPGMPGVRADGTLAVPAGHGLGYEVDEAVLR